MTQGNQKYIFIDANIYRSLYSESSDFSDEIMELLEKLSRHSDTKLLLPQQVEDEVLRNSKGKWFQERDSAVNSQIHGIEEKQKKLEQLFGDYRHTDKIKKQLEGAGGKLKAESKKIRTQFLSNHSRSNIKVNKLFNLSQKIDETEVILQRAFFRREKGNPPHEKNTERKLGDYIIWESLLDFLSNKKSQQPVLVFVSRDNRAWESDVSEKDKLEFNPWLQEEYKQKTKGEVIFINNISDIPNLTEEEQEKIQLAEAQERIRRVRLNLKTIIPERLKTSNSWDNSERLMKYIEVNRRFLDCDAINLILSASIQNNKYSSGPYNQVTDAGRALKFFDVLLNTSYQLKCDLEEWKSFYLSFDQSQQKYFYDLRKSLEEHDIKFELDEPDLTEPKDDPFPF